MRPAPTRWLQERAEAISAELYSSVAMAGGWDPIPESDVEDAMQKMPPTTLDDLDQNALKLGHDVSADGVLYGTVETYKERVGMDYSASSPASVAFALKFVDMKSGQIVWTAKFAKSQAALSQNLFDLANFVQRSGRWVRAHEIAQEGVEGSGRRSSRRSQPVAKRQALRNRQLRRTQVRTAAIQHWPAGHLLN